MMLQRTSMLTFSVRFQMKVPRNILISREIRQVIVFISRPQNLLTALVLVLLVIMKTRQQQNFPPLLIGMVRLGQA